MMMLMKGRNCWFGECERRVLNGWVEVFICLVFYWEGCVGKRVWGGCLNVLLVTWALLWGRGGGLGWVFNFCVFCLFVFSYKKKVFSVHEYVWVDLFSKFCDYGDN